MFFQAAHADDRCADLQAPGNNEVNAKIRRLRIVPGVGPVTAGAMLAFTPDLRTFTSGRNFAAWLGLVPRSDPRAGKPGRALSAGWDQVISGSS